MTDEGEAEDSEDVMTALSALAPGRQRVRAIAWAHTPAGAAPTGLPADAGVFVAVVAGPASFLP